MHQPVATLHSAMNQNAQRLARFRPALRLLAAAMLLAFSFTILAAPALLSSRNCPMPCCMAKKAARMSSSSGHCATQCGMTRNTPAQQFPRTVQPTVSTTTHAVATVVATISNERSAAGLVARPGSAVAHPSDAPLHVLNSVFLI